MGRAGRAEIAMAGDRTVCHAARDAVTGVMCEKRGVVSKRPCALPSFLRHSMNSMFLLFFAFFHTFRVSFRATFIRGHQRIIRESLESHQRVIGESSEVISERHHQCGGTYSDSMRVVNERTTCSCTPLIQGKSHG